VYWLYPAGRAVAEAALDGLLDGAALRALDPGDAVQRVQQVKGLGPFAAELVVVRGANAPDALPHHERRLDAEIAERYGPGRTLAEVSQAWRPYRTWAPSTACAARAAHRRDRRSLSHPARPGALSDHALNR
jgi:3-methyladenine DNA glycosylase/8-oxoguanine DNA glycosylase